MTVSNQLPVTIVLGNGTKGPYSFAFDLLESEKTDFIVHLIEVDKLPRLLLYGIDYDVQINSAGTGGSITLVSEAPSADTKIRMERVIEIEQPVIFDNNKNIIPKNIEQVADDCIKIAQQQQVILNDLTGNLFSFEVDFNNAIQRATEQADRSEEASLLSHDWAVKMDGLVEGVDYSSKYWANQSETGAAESEEWASQSSVSASLSKDWAVKMDGLVEGVDYSAKHWANEALIEAVQASDEAAKASLEASRSQDWAVKMDGLVDGTDYSAKYWAAQAWLVARGDDIPLPEDGKPGLSLVVNDQKTAYTFAKLVDYNFFITSTTNNCRFIPSGNAIIRNILRAKQIESGSFAPADSNTTYFYITNQELEFKNQVLQNVSAIQLGFWEFMPIALSGAQTSDVNTFYFGQFGNLRGSTSSVQCTNPTNFYKFVSYYDCDISAITWKFYVSSQTANTQVRMRLKFYQENKQVLLFDTGVLTSVTATSPSNLYRDILATIPAPGLSFKKDTIYYMQIDVNTTSVMSTSTYTGFIYPSAPLRFNCVVNKANNVPDRTYALPNVRDFMSTELYKVGNLEAQNKTVIDTFSPMDIVIETIKVPEKIRGKIFVTFTDSTGNTTIQLYPKEYTNTILIGKQFNGLTKVTHEFQDFGDFDRAGNVFSGDSLYNNAVFTDTTPKKLFSFEYDFYSVPIVPIEFVTKPYPFPPYRYPTKILIRMYILSTYEEVVDLKMRASSGDLLPILDEYVSRSDTTTLREYLFANTEDNYEVTLEFKQLNNVKMTLRFVDMMLIL